MANARSRRESNENILSQLSRDVTASQAVLASRVTRNKGVVHMRVGIGLPTGVPGMNGQLIIEWAQRADAGPFSSLGVIDRLIYDSYDPLIALAAAAAVTRRVRLATTIIISLLHNTPILAK